MKIISEKYKNLKKYNSDFRIAKPFPHIILDNFLDESFFQKLNVEKIRTTKKKVFYLILKLKLINGQVKMLN